MNQTSELKDRVAAKRKELQARLLTMRADAKGKSTEEATKIEAKLEELSDNLNEGWDKLTEASAKKINHWLKPDDD